MGSPGDSAQVPSDETIRLPAMGQQDPAATGCRVGRRAGLSDGVRLVRVFAQDDRRRLPAAPAGPVQPRDARRAARHRLPLLPQHGGGRGPGRHAAHRDLHELSCPGAHAEPEARAHPREHRNGQAHRVGEGARSARLRLLQPQRPRDPRRRLRDLPRARRPDGRGLPEGAPQHGVVPRLPSRAGAESAPAERGDEHDLDSAEPDLRPGVPEAEQHQPPEDCSGCHR